MTALPIRIYALAKQLNRPTEMLVGVGRGLGLEVNGLSMLNPAEQAAIEKAVRDRPPEEPAGGVASKLPPHGPRPGAVRQQLLLPGDDEDDSIWSKHGPRLA